MLTCEVTVFTWSTKRLTPVDLSIRNIHGHDLKNDYVTSAPFSTNEGKLTCRNFDPATYDSDLALIKLRSKVHFTDYIMPICLGDTEFIRKTFFNYKDLRYGTVAGWGKLSERGGQPRFLQEIKLPLVNPDQCRASTTHPVSFE